eukprot:m.383407 g.383407  ORF g.383407 m.383407 type:complete len:652 (-) comp16729_c0_seq4:172-2127(-)
MGKRGVPAGLQDALDLTYNFNITFENGTNGSDDDDFTAEERIILRIIHQLTSRTTAWKDLLTGFRNEESRGQLSFTSFFEWLAGLTGCDVSEVSILLCIDAVQSAGKLDYTAQVMDESSPLRQVIATAAALMCDNGRKDRAPFCFVCLSATTEAVLSRLPSSRISKDVIRLTPINGKSIFAFNDNLPNLWNILYDMGGHPRALEYLYKALLNHNKTELGWDVEHTPRKTIKINGVPEHWKPQATMDSIALAISNYYLSALTDAKEVLRHVFVGTPVADSQTIPIRREVVSANGESETAYEKVPVSRITAAGFVTCREGRLHAPFVFVDTVFYQDRDFGEFFDEYYRLMAIATARHITGDNVCDAAELEVARHFLLKLRMLAVGPARSTHTVDFADLITGALRNPAWKTPQVKIAVPEWGVKELRTKVFTKSFAFSGLSKIGMSQKTISLMERGPNDSYKQMTLGNLTSCIAVNGAKAAAGDIYIFMKVPRNEERPLLNKGLRKVFGSRSPNSHIDREGWEWAVLGISVKVTPSTPRTIELVRTEMSKAIKTKKAGRTRLFLEVAYADTNVKPSELPIGCALVSATEMDAFFGLRSRLFEAVDSVRKAPPKPDNDEGEEGTTVTRSGASSGKRMAQAGAKGSAYSDQETSEV